MTRLALLIGPVVGGLFGIAGIGGGILFVRPLVWFLGMDQYKAQGISPGALLAPIGILALLEYYRRGHADLRVALLLAVGFTNHEPLYQDGRDEKQAARVAFLNA